MLGDDANAAWVERAVRSGADGFVTKFCEAQEVVDAVRRGTLDGRRHFSQDVMNSSLAAYTVFGSDDEPHRQLSPREFEVFVQLGEGKSLKGISHDLVLHAGNGLGAQAQHLEEDRPGLHRPHRPLLHGARAGQRRRVTGLVHHCFRR